MLLHTEACGARQQLLGGTVVPCLGDGEPSSSVESPTGAAAQGVTVLESTCSGGTTREGSCSALSLWPTCAGPGPGGAPSCSPALTLLSPHVACWPPAHRLGLSAGTGSELGFGYKACTGGGQHIACSPLCWGENVPMCNFPGEDRHSAGEADPPARMGKLCVPPTSLARCRANTSCVPCPLSCVPCPHALVRRICAWCSILISC